MWFLELGWNKQIKGTSSSIGASVVNPTKNEIVDEMSRTFESQVRLTDKEDLKISMDVTIRMEKVSAVENAKEKRAPWLVDINRIFCLKYLRYLVNLCICMIILTRAYVCILELLSFCILNMNASMDVNDTLPMELWKFCI